jgi:uncharacterized protein
MIRVVLVIILLYSCKSLPGKKESHLANASSPYLREHADNPVEWYEWGDEAIEKAKKENKPLLISIGYAACHWCHVMEEESFMDTAVARIMNEQFVNIKVDREERPDIDNIYMNACQLITGSGGWPLNAFALPDGKPFFAGTYYTKQSWTNLLQQISQAFRNKNKVVVQQAEALTQGIAEQELSFLKPDSQSTVITRAGYDALFDSVMKNMDLRNGGLKGSPKFPMPVVSEFLLQYHYLTGNEKALVGVETALAKMATGGINDHVGGGFARYSTDSVWKVPHFEKMLYDNGQLLSLYAHAYQVTKNPWYRQIVNDIAHFISGELLFPGGGFYSSLNADTESGEGYFYSWSYNEFRQITGNTKEGELLTEYFSIIPEGNWENGRNILYAKADPFAFAKERGINFYTLMHAIETGMYRLKIQRNKRSRPSIDTKILASWNAIAMNGYLDAYMATGDTLFFMNASGCARFIEKNMLGKDGHLWRSYKDGKATIDGFLDDYAWTAKAYLALYQVTFDKHWLTLAKSITDYAIKHFYDERSGLFFYTSANASGLVVRKMEVTDNVIPSSNATMAELLHKLGTCLEDKNLLDKSARMLSQIAGKMSTLTSYYAQWCYLAGLFSHGTYEVAIMGKVAIEKNKELQRNYLPNCVFIGATKEENLPLLENKLVDDQTLIYVCTNRVCKRPVSEPEKALEQIHSKKK